MEHVDRDISLRDYWKQRMDEHGHDLYRGRSLVKMPEDLRTYEQVIEQTTPDTIIELGTYAGGSALWFRDRLRLFSTSPDILVVTIDTSTHCAPFAPADQIVLLEGDLTSQATVGTVATLLEGRHRVMVVDDSAHSYDITTKALELYGGFVEKGFYFVVEDGVVDEPDLTIWPNVSGVQPAIRDFLETPAGGRFVQIPHESFGLTMHFGGWLYAGETS